MKSSLSLLALLLAGAPVLAGDLDESVDGDLSGDRLNPTVLNLSVGSNTVLASQQGAASGLDVDYLTVVVPAGTQLARLDCTSYSAVDGNSNLAFLGVQQGPVFTTDAATTKASDLYGGTVYGFFSPGTDILPTMGSLSGTIGFTPPLFEGSYTFWFNQTGLQSTVGLDFVLEGTIGTGYCAANANSSGQAASLRVIGSSLASDDSVTLEASGLPVGTPGLFFFGPNQVQVPFGDGLRCVGGSVQRLQPPSFAPAGGVVRRDLDLAALGLTAGTTVNLQYWYRDPAGGPSGFNLSDGVSLTLQ
jgi:hypothetical protein